MLLSLNRRFFSINRLQKHEINSVVKPVVGSSKPLHPKSLNLTARTKPFKLWV